MRFQNDDTMTVSSTGWPSTFPPRVMVETVIDGRKGEVFMCPTKARKLAAKLLKAADKAER